MTEPTQNQSMHSTTAWRRSVPRALHHILPSFFVLVASSFAMAQAPGCGNACQLYSSLLLAPERELIGSIRTLEQVAQPAVGPRNTRGRWIQRDVYLGIEAFDSTFYLKSGRVQRIELVSTAPEDRCRARTPWAGAIAALTAWQAKEAVTGQFDTGNNMQQAAHWSAGDLDASVYLSVTADACSTKVAFKKREVKDASEL